MIVPSFPGFGFSTPLPDHPDMNFWKVADLWHTLMTETLGHERYAAAGCDVGALVTGQLGHKHADELYAIHIGSGLKLDLFNGDRAWDLSEAGPSPRGCPQTFTRRSWPGTNGSPSTSPRTCSTRALFRTRCRTHLPGCSRGSCSAG